MENTLKLLDEGCTIPFISRYRKERTGGLDEVQITAISNRLEQLQEIAKRKDTVVKTITELGKMTPDASTTVGTRLRWRTSICLTSPNVAHVPR